MRRMSALDAQFLYLEDENPASHAHTIKVSIYEPGPEGYSFSASKDAFRARLHRLPPFRWRAVPTPFDLHHPVWIEDPSFDLDFHVRRMAAPQPGGQKELGEIVSEIASRALDRSRPLWELYLVEGLEGGRVAAVAKVHHAVADGVSSAELLDLYHDLEPQAPPRSTDPVPAAGPEHHPEAVPSRTRLLLAAIRDVVRLLVTGLPAMLAVAKEVRARRTVEGLAAADAPPKPFTAPPVSFNNVITPHRQFAFTTLSLEDAKRVKNAFGATINDVFLAAVAGGLRRYLEPRGELPDQPLVASVPVSTRSEEQAGTWGNQLAKMYVSLPTHIGDPVERLQAARSAARTSKDELQVTRGARLENWIEFFPLPLLRLTARLFIRIHRHTGRATENLIVSNVPGPKQPLWAGSARLSAFYSVGPVSPGIGLNITVWSYVDQLNISLIACREAVPDLWALTDAIRESAAELIKEAEHVDTKGHT